MSGIGRAIRGQLPLPGIQKYRAFDLRFSLFFVNFLGVVVQTFLCRVLPLTRNMPNNENYHHPAWNANDFCLPKLWGRFRFSHHRRCAWSIWFLLRGWCIPRPWGAACIHRIRGGMGCSKVDLVVVWLVVWQYVFLFQRRDFWHVGVSRPTHLEHRRTPS